MTPHIQTDNSELAMPTLDSSGNTQDMEDFIYLISHDVRASVRALIELPQWIEEDLEEAGFKIDGPVRNSIEMMNRHTGRLDRMLVDLLTFSRVGRMQEMERHDIAVALRTVLDEIKLPAGFEVTQDLQCSNVTMGNRDILTLFDALIRNVAKHHDQPAGRIHVTALQDGDETVISVADDGPGILPEYRERVFGAMRTLKSRDEVEGSGMGLANVSKIASLYGGSARVLESPFGRGALIEVRVKAT